ncbi:MAG TPA: hypothetical protein PKB13_08375 [Clostridia bacterium]|nr:hypothetical protein [Clostridia bacterium]
MIKNPLKLQSFEDGVVAIYATVAPRKIAAEPKRVLRYHERTVGIGRHYAAKQANALVAYVLRCPRLRDVSAQDIAVPNDGKQYRITLVQYPEDVQPPSMDLTLEEVQANYDIAGP